VDTVNTARLWTVQIDDAVANVTLVGSVVTVKSPSASERLVRIHASANNGLIGVFFNGTVASIQVDGTVSSCSLNYVINMYSG
jgi:hypothetical protein